MSSTRICSSQALRYDSKGGLGQSILADFSEGGYNCFDGRQVEEPNLNQTIYRIQSLFDPKTRMHTTEAAGLHVTLARHLKDVVLDEHYKKLDGMTEKERAKRCGGKVVDSIFAGHRVIYNFTYHLEANEAEPPTFDVTLGNSPDEIKQIKEKYAPVFTNVKATHTDDYFFGEEPWQDMKLNPEIKPSPLDIIVAYIQMMEPVGDDAKNRNFLPIVHVSPAPKY
jgi:hypothetical protein